MSILGRKIEGLCLEAGLKLKTVCDTAGVNYKTLHQQISRDSRIPFETVDAIAHHLGVPLERFSQRVWGASDQPVVVEQLVGVIEAFIREANEASPQPTTTKELWSRLSSSGFSLGSLDGLVAHCDIYHPLAPEDTIPHPIEFGENGASRRYLGLTSPKQYYEKVKNFDAGIRSRSMAAHRLVDELPFSVASEWISEDIDGERVTGCYLRTIARVFDGSGSAKTLVFTEPVGFGQAEKLDLPAR